MSSRVPSYFKQTALSSKPPSRWRHWRRVLGCTVLFLVLAGAAFGIRRLYDPNYFPVKSIRIQGQYAHIPETELQTLLTPYWNYGFFGMPTKQLRQQLLEHPWISAVSIRRVWPDQLHVQIYEHRPMVRWGQQAMISETGELFFPKIDDELAELPQLNGPEAQRNTLFVCYQNLSKALTPFQLKIRSMEQSDRGAWRVQLSSGTWLELGRDQLPERFNRFLKVYHQLWYQKEKQPSSVDLRYANGMAVKYISGSSPTGSSVEERVSGSETSERVTEHE